MIRIDISTALPYSVYLGKNILPEGCSLFRSLVCGKKVMIITDTHVATCLPAVKNFLSQVGFTPFSFVMDAGEKNKNFSTYYRICESLGNNHFCREDSLVALGGGVVGDMTGFVASTYMRGIDYMQIPTSLLAMIDSSVGGKTAIDMPFGKNCIGTFYQPKLVLIDTQTLDTLPQKEWKNGMGEGLKYAFLDQRIFSVLPYENVLTFIESCVRFKGEIVQQDEKDKNLRAVLNLGHTVGHALEQLSHYTLSHGECVAQGLFVCLFSAEKENQINDDYREMLNLLKKYFSFSLPFSKEDILNAIRFDKKKKGDGVTFIQTRGIGNCLPVYMTFEELEKYLTW